MDALERVLGKYNKEASGSIIKLSDSAYKKIQRIPTGSFALNIATGGGFPCSAIIELYGEESTGKSLETLIAIAAYQKEYDKPCAYIDLEESITLEWAEKVGVDTSRLYIAKPTTAEKALDLAIDLVGSKKLGIVVVDSVAALCPIVELESSLSDQQMGVAARLMSKTMRVLAAKLKPDSLDDKEKYNPTTIIFINQTREKIGVMFGSPITTPGGKALKFYSHVRVCIKRGEQIKKNKKLIGLQVKFNVVKNKTHKPYQVGEFSFYYDGYIDNEEAIVNYAIVYELVKQAGPWYYFGEEKFQGKDKLIAHLKTKPKVLLKLKKDIIDIVQKG